MATVAQIKRATCTLTDEQGRELTVTLEVFEAFACLLLGKGTGTVKVEFKDGGIAGVEATTVKRYK